MSEIKIRLLEFLKYLNKGQTKFEQEVGISRGAINNIKGGISTSTLNKISSLYPQLNTSWLLTGEGPMLIDHSEPPNITNQINDDEMSDQNKFNRLIDLLETRDEIILKQQNEYSKQGERIDRLISLLEKLSGTNEDTKIGTSPKKRNTNLSTEL